MLTWTKSFSHHDHLEQYGRQQQPQQQQKPWQFVQRNDWQRSTAQGIETGVQVGKPAYFRGVGGELYAQLGGQWF